MVSDVASFPAFLPSLTASRKFDCFCSSFLVLLIKSTTSGNVVVWYDLPPTNRKRLFAEKRVVTAIDFGIRPYSGAKSPKVNVIVFLEKHLCIYCSFIRVT